MSPTNDKDLPQPLVTSSALPLQTVFGDENVYLGAVDWTLGVVGGKVHLGDTGRTSNVGTGGRIRGISVSTFVHFLFKVIETIKQESFQLFLKVLSVLLHSHLHRQQVP